MKFSIVTATIQRPSLRDCCASLDQQTYQDWEHIVVVDAEIALSWVGELNADPRRRVIVPGIRFANFGNTPRWMAWQLETGDYQIILDDDNYFADATALARIAACLEQSSLPAFALFPILRFGHSFLVDPPGVCATDSANMVLRRDIARWPNRDEYTLDGILAAELATKHTPQMFPFEAPIITVPVQGKGLLAL